LRSGPDLLDGARRDGRWVEIVDDAAKVEDGVIRDEHGRLVARFTQSR
jgi:hypothetical protein